MLIVKNVLVLLTTIAPFAKVDNTLRPYQVHVSLVIPINVQRVK